VTPFEAYEKYIALKLHFSTDRYNYFTFDGKIKISRDSFEKRNDKPFFYRLAKKYKTEEIEQYLVANFLDNPENWVGDIIAVEGDDVLKSHQKKIQSLTYNFKQDVTHLHEFSTAWFNSFDCVFVAVRGMHPVILDMALQKEINIETFIIINKILNFFPKFDKKIKVKLIWDEFKNKSLKYEPFLKNIDKKEFKNIMKEILVNTGKIK
jgi:hypothetical protein